MNKTLSPSIVILTYNEEANIGHCLSSVAGWSDEVFVVDSHSTDKTLEIARQYTGNIFPHAFAGYSPQRNWALDNLPFSNEWVFFLDADERPTDELKEEIGTMLAAVPKDIAGFYIKRRFLFMGRWIKHGGYYPTWLLRLFRHHVARCDDRAVNEHFFVQGKTAQLKYDIIHEDKRGLDRWVGRHNEYATLEAKELYRQARRNQEDQGSLLGNQVERKRWIRERIVYRLPPFIRAFLYFCYRYFFRLGFLDGKAGLVYHVLQGFWFPFLVDAKLEELKMTGMSENGTD